MFALYCQEEARIVAVGSSRYQATEGYTVHEIEPAEAAQIAAEMGAYKLTLAAGKVQRGRPLTPADFRVKGGPDIDSLQAERAQLVARLAALDEQIAGLEKGGKP